MLRTKFRGNRSTGSGEEDFLMVFTICRCGDHLGHVTQMPRTNFLSPNPWRLHTKFGIYWCSGFEEEVLTLWTDDDRQGTMADTRALGIPGEPMTQAS